MKRLQIMIEADLDEALEAQALREGVSKAALLRRAARDLVKPLPPIEEDPLWQLAGDLDFEPVADIDEVIYG
ncbi:MAG TPA: CopG family transcriptional regulator [Candidatus Limnocylindrales bacterium]|nr:CopG family transcriptional regulator [Candidatus Limnocylindrales bacterium]